MNLVNKTFGVNKENELKFAEFVVECGIRDGCSKKLETSCDGLPFEYTGNVIDSFNNILFEKN